MSGVTLECSTVCPLTGSDACTSPVRLVVPSCCASTSPTLLTVATVWLAILKIVAAWGLGPPVLRTCKQIAIHFNYFCEVVDARYYISVCV